MSRLSRRHQLACVRMVQVPCVYMLACMCPCHQRDVTACDIVHHRQANQCRCPHSAPHGVAINNSPPLESDYHCFLNRKRLHFGSFVRNRRCNICESVITSYGNSYQTAPYCTSVDHLVLSNNSRRKLYAHKMKTTNVSVVLLEVYLKKHCAVASL